MRRRDREVTGRDALEAILKACRVCRLGMTQGGTPYIVPLNFGYRWTEEGLTLWFHSAARGRKLDGLRGAETVAFEMDCEHALSEGEAPCDCSYRFASLMGLGRPVFCSTAEEKAEGLDLLMAHQTGRGGHSYPPAMLEGTAVFCLEVTELSGKRHL